MTDLDVLRWRCTRATVGRRFHLWARGMSGPMETTITTGDLADTLAEVLDRVETRGERFVVERNGERVATIAPPTSRGITLAALIAQVGDLGMPGDGFADDLEAIQASQDEAELREWPP